MGTTRKTVKKRSNSAADSLSKSKKKGKPTKPKGKRKSGPPIGPIIKWSRPMCFALGLTVAHQHKPRLNGTMVCDWKAVLRVINAIYLQEYPAFKEIYPNGMVLAGKLRSAFSEKERGRFDHWCLRPDQCKPAEVQELHRMSDLVFATELRLSQEVDSIVLAPGPNAVKWVTYNVELRPPKDKAEKKRKSRAKKDSKPEAGQREAVEQETSTMNDGDDSNTEAEHSNNFDAEEQEISMVDDGGVEIEEEEQSNTMDADEQEFSMVDDDHDEIEEDEQSNNMDVNDDESLIGSDDPSQGDDESDEDEDEDNLADTSRSSQVDKDEDDEGPSDEDVFPAAAVAKRAITKIKPSRRARPASRLAQPQRNKNRLQELPQDADDDEQPAASSFGDLLHSMFPDPEEFRRRHKQSHRLALRYDEAMRAKSSPASSDPPIEELDDQIIKSPRVTHGGLLRRHKQSDMNALRYDEATRVKRSPASSNPPIEELGNQVIKAPRVYYGDGRTKFLPKPVVYSYEACRRTLISRFQARNWVDLWAEIRRVPGYDIKTWNVDKDLIDPIALTTGLGRGLVSAIVREALDKRAISSLTFAQLLAKPNKVPKSRGDDNETLGNIFQEIKKQPKLTMIHTKDVKWDTELPTYTIRHYASDSGNDFRYVDPTNDTTYGQTGEVRRVLFTDATTGEGKEVDVMLCDEPICATCSPHQNMFDHTFDYNFACAEQRKQLPLVHHKDVAMFEDTKLYFVPMKQSRVLADCPVAQKDIHEVVFGNCMTSKVIFCDKAMCGACSSDDVSCVAGLVWTSGQ